MSFSGVPSPSPPSTSPSPQPTATPIVNGLIPLYLTTSTLKELSIEGNEKYIKLFKSSIQQHIQSNGRSSEFYTTHYALENYVDEKLLLIHSDMIHDNVTEKQKNMNDSNSVKNDIIDDSDANYYLTVTYEAYEDYLLDMQYYNEKYGKKGNNQTNDTKGVNPGTTEEMVNNEAHRHHDDDDIDDLHDRAEDDDLEDMSMSATHHSHRGGDGGGGGDSDVDSDTEHENSMSRHHSSSSHSRYTRSIRGNTRSAGGNSGGGGSTHKSHLLGTSSHKSSYGVRSLAQSIEMLDEIEQITYQVQPNRSKIRYVIQQPRLKFAKPISEFDDMNGVNNEKLNLNILSHTSAHPHTHNNNTPRIYRHVVEGGFQAASLMRDTGAQTNYTAKYNKALQYTPLTMSESQRYEIIYGSKNKSFQKFLETAYKQLRYSMLSNECLDLYKDEFHNQYITYNSSNKSGGHRDGSGTYMNDDEEEGSIVGIAGKSDSTLEIYHTYHHLLYSKNKAVTQIQWIMNYQYENHLHHNHNAAHTTLTSSHHHTNASKTLGSQPPSNTQSTVPTSTKQGSTTSTTTMSSKQHKQQSLHDRKGGACLAFSCSVYESYDKWIENSGRTYSTYILFYNLIDLLHPIQILQIPGNVTCFQVNPLHQYMIVAGMENGQICLFNLKQQPQSKLHTSIHQNHNTSSNKPDESQKGGNEKNNMGTDTSSTTTATTTTTISSASYDTSSSIQPILPIILTSLDRSHTRPVTSIQWLPVDRHVNKKGELHHQMSEQCTQFVSTAGDGKLLFWDYLQKVDQKQSSGHTTTMTGSTSNTSIDTSMKYGSVSITTLQNPATNQSSNGMITGGGGTATNEYSHTHLLEENKWYPLATLPCNKSDGIPAYITHFTLSASSSTFSPTSLLAATEDAEVLYVDWLHQQQNKVRHAGGGTDSDDTNSHTSGSTSSSIVTSSGSSVLPSTSNKISHISVLNHTSHHSSICDIVRSPHDHTLFATVGDWGLRLWRLTPKNINSGELLEPIWEVQNSHEIVTCVGFSPSRPSVICVGKHDGSVDLYDLLDSAHKPILTFDTGFSDSIKSLAFWSSSTQQLQYLAVGDTGGKLHVMEVPRVLRRKIAAEDQLIHLFFQREIQKLKYNRKRYQQRKQHDEREADELHSKKKSGMAISMNITDDIQYKEKDKENGDGSLKSANKQSIDDYAAYEAEYQTLLSEYMKKNDASQPQAQSVQ